MLKNNFLLLFFLFISCGFNFDQEKLAEELSDKYPDKVFENFDYKKNNKNEIIYEVKAVKVETFSNKKESHLYGLQFKKYNENGEKIIEGSADYVEFYIESNNLYFKDNITLNIIDEDAVLQADYLFWNDEEKKLSSNTGIVKIKKSNGTYLEGYNFTADSKLLNFSFLGSVKGNWVGDNEK